MHKKYLTFLSVIILLTVTNLYPQNKDYSGIKFNSYNVELQQRTSAVLFNGEAIRLKNNFSISFDLSFWSLQYFGPILRLKQDEKEFSRLVFNQFKDRKNYYLQLFVHQLEDPLEIKISRSALPRNLWLNVEIEFDLISNSVSLFMNKELSAKASIELPNELIAKFYFGLVNSNDLNDIDLPGFYLKDIKIKENNNTKYHWELNPQTKKPLKDKISNSNIAVVNQAWVCEDHTKWRKLADIKISDHGISYLGIAYDSSNSRLFIDKSDNLLIYDLITGKDSLIKYKTKSSAIWNELFYDYDKQLLYSFITGMGKVSVYDLNKNEWITKDTSKNTTGHYFGSAKFCYPNSDDMYLLGGYGWYSAKCDLFKYDFNQRKWKKVKLNKNEMTPRAWFTLGKGFNDGEFIIYGGFGNKSGNQERGFNQWHDIYILNLNDSTIKKVDSFKENKYQTEQHLSLINYLYLNKRDSTFYYLSRDKNRELRNYQLNKFDLKTGISSQVGDQFHSQTGDKWIFHYLHYSKSTNEFIAVFFDSTTVELYAINYPPISETEKTYTEQTSLDNNAVIVILVPTAIFMAVLLFYYVRKRKSKSSLPSGIKTNNGNTIHSEVLAFKNSVNLFGGFHIYNNEGKDIISDFSQKLKEILLLILLRSFTHYQHKGITSEELSTIIWPDSSPESVKSSRGVAINKIRKLLSETEGIDIQFDEKVWVVNFSNFAGCDYLNYLSLKNFVNKNNSPDENLIDSLLVAIEGGEFLKCISYVWLDPIKVSINNEIIQLVKRIWEFDNIKTDNSTLIKLCETVLKFDSVDEEAIKLLIRTLCLEGKNSLAKSKYQIFVAEHKRLYDENYSQSFQELTS